MAENKNNRILLKNLESVGKELLVGVLDDLVGKDVLKLEKSERKKFEEATPRQKTRLVVDSILQKRHIAGEVLLQTLLNTNKNATQTKVPPALTARPPESVETADGMKLCPHEKFLRISQERAGEIYPIKEKVGRTRLALIICNTEFEQLSYRHGAEHDIRGMQALLKSLDYTVDVKEQLTATAMEDALREFAARPEHRSSDSTFLVFMSHGTLEGICGIKHGEKNLDMLPNDTIFQIFNTRNCTSLKDKPKVVIIQTCRGERLGATVVSDDSGASADSSSPENVEDDAVCRTHVEKDFIAFYSSTPHTKSWRDTTRGSYFILELITCLQNYAWCCHLLEVFQKVQQSFEKRCDRFQMPTIERLNMPKCFYLFPGN
ncbi:PREDICTED: caspase-13-like [Condylura cristata]|uniref:caspase-13-like n=1 Tax=Condylura cristata TaxID=143302 RepID=UPI000642E43E|nr:PREDICTED: caspase-13-like [Condylura cristata]XP_012584781.1 PREDICTED: caspase-13-like [Condylura cristata]